VGDRRERDYPEIRALRREGSGTVYPGVYR
jgi:hypothetical protein